jgi:thiamine biosynthesis lipoprotein
MVGNRSCQGEVLLSMSVQITRRRLITVAAIAAGLPLALHAGRAQARLVSWEGSALGAPASIQLYHTDEAKARAAIAASLDELARLEAIFSVHRADSAISRLNRAGSLAAPPAELVELMTYAATMAEITDGIYDPTIQPVWQMYFRHFTAATVDPAGPSERDIAAALALVGWRDVEIAADRLAFARPGMGVTLNGVAQGFITDRVAAILRAHGFGSVLVDMGEPRALSAKPDGSAWRIGIANPADASRAVTEISVTDKCVATSGGYGTLFDADARFTHLIDPRTGHTAPALAGVSVVADTATVADGLSTAMLLVPAERRQDVLRRAGGDLAIYVTPDGVTARVEA